MTQPKIVLHQWRISPFCGKIRKVLAFKGLAFEVVEYAGLRSLKVKDLSSPGKLPVLDLDGERFEDSSVIARMLEARFPKPSLTPGQPVARHLAHLLEDWADESLYWFELWARFCDPVAHDRASRLLAEGRPDFERTLVKLGTKRYGRAVVTQGLGRYSDEHVLAELRAHLVAIDGLLAGSAWLTGDEPSIADVAVSAQLDELKRTSRYAGELDAHARLADWLLRCQFETAAQSSTVSA
jgi:glutathione S-transferase